MHEYHIVEGIVKQVIDIAQNNHASKVTRVRIVMDELCGFEESSLRLYFENISNGTLAEGAQLIVKTVTISPSRTERGVYIEDIEIESA